MSAPIKTPRINAPWREHTTEIAAALRDLAATITRLTEAAKKGEQQ
ncbi:hypothetical protein [Microbacterium sp. bgisy189]